MSTINTLSFPGFGIDEFKVNEVAFTIFGVSVYWYGLIIVCGMILAVLYVLRHWKKEGWDTDSFLDVAIALLLCGVLGARLYYVVFKFDTFLVTSGSFFENLLDTFLNIINFRDGGLAIYGGLICGSLAAYLVIRKKKISVGKFFDMTAPAVALAQAMGRWGNFINAEAYGAETTLPWRMGIHHGYGWRYYHPTFLYESLWNVIGFVILNALYKRKKYDGQVVYFYIAWYGLGRMLIEGLRTDSLMLGSIRVSQLLAALLLVAATALMIFVHVRKKRTAEEKFDSIFAQIDSGEYGKQPSSDAEVCTESEEETKQEEDKNDGSDSN